MISWNLRCTSLTRRQSKIVTKFKAKQWIQLVMMNCSCDLIFRSTQPNPTTIPFITENWRPAHWFTTAVNAARRSHVRSVWSAINKMITMKYKIQVQVDSETNISFLQIMLFKTFRKLSSKNGFWTSILTSSIIVWASVKYISNRIDLAFFFDKWIFEQ